MTDDTLKYHTCTLPSFDPNLVDCPECENVLSILQLKREERLEYYV